MSSSNSDDENTDKIVKKEITIITWGNKKRKCCPVRVHKNWNVTGISDKKPKHLDLAHLDGRNEEMQKCKNIYLSRISLMRISRLS